MKQKLTGLKVSDLKVGDKIGPFIIKAACDEISLLELDHPEYTIGEAMTNESVEALIDAFGVEREAELETVASGEFSWNSVGSPRINDMTPGTWIEHNAKPGDTIEVRRAK